MSSQGETDPAPVPEDVHPGEYADVMPDMSDDEFTALKRSLREDGQRHPIEVTPDGEIVDGHHRYRACEELGIAPEITVVEGATVEQAIRANFTRRDHSDGTKRGVVEAYLREHYDGERTQRDVAEELGVSVGTVNAAWQNVQPEQFSREEKRQQVAEYLDRNPDASNREAADAVEADVSHATVGNWRSEWESGGDDEEPESDPAPESEASEPPTDSREHDASDGDGSDVTSGTVVSDGDETEVGEQTIPQTAYDSGEAGVPDGEGRSWEEVANERDGAKDRIAELEAENERLRSKQDGDASVKQLRRMLQACKRRQGDVEAFVGRALDYLAGSDVTDEDLREARVALEDAEAVLEGD